MLCEYLRCKYISPSLARSEIHQLESFALLISFIMNQLRLTELWKPGYFDIWGQSYQIFHVGMAIGLSVHFLAFVRAVDQFYIVKHGQCPE